MGAHFKITQYRMISPRLHYLDHTAHTGLVYVGYIGRHLPTQQTNWPLDRSTGPRSARRRCDPYYVRGPRGDRGGPMTLRFGVFLAPFHPAGENPTLALQRDLSLVEHLDALGYDEAWIGEHHSAGSEIIASPEIFMIGRAHV